MNVESLRKNSILLSRCAGRERGLSLIELMIALGLGVFIVAGIFQVTVGSRQAFEVIQAQAMTQESGRFATQFIADTTRNAGYINYGSVDAGNGNAFAQTLIDTLEFSENINSRWPAQGEFEAGAVLAGGDDASLAAFDDAKAESDFLSIRMQGDASFDKDAAGGFSMSDCEGKMLASDQATTTIINYFIKDNNTLACRVDTESGSVTTGAVQELVSGIEDMQIIYAVREVGGISFKPASELAGQWTDVTSVRVALLAVSDNKPLDRESDNSYQLFDQDRTDPEDGRIRQVFYQTIALRNR